jgi:hypothetical protein
MKLQRKEEAARRYDAFFSTSSSSPRVPSIWAKKDSSQAKNFTTRMPGGEEMERKGDGKERRWKGKEMERKGDGKEIHNTQTRNKKLQDKQQQDTLDPQFGQKKNKQKNKQKNQTKPPQTRPHLA